MPDAPAAPITKGRQGGRWVNERPSSEEFAEWAKGSIKVDEKLDLGDYIGGIVLIPAVDSKSKVVLGFITSTGAPVIAEREELSFIPYAKVETRINYFWDLLQAHPEWSGQVESITPPRVPIDFVTVRESRETSSSSWTKRELMTPSAMTALIHQLPPGFHVLSVPVGSNYTHFLCCTKRVSIYRVDEDGVRAKHPMRTGEGTKMVPLVLGRQSFYADPNSIMKAETGALGRALGFAGIFVIPGSGVATAEDMQEMLATQPAAQQDPTAEPGQQGPSAPTATPVRTGAEQQVDTEEQLAERARVLWRDLSKTYPEKAAEFGVWAQSRTPPIRNLSDVKGPALRGVVKKMEKLVQEAVDAEAQVESAADKEASLDPIPDNRDRSAEIPVESRATQGPDHEPLPPAAVA